MSGRDKLRVWSLHSCPTGRLFLLFFPILICQQSHQMRTLKHLDLAYLAVGTHVLWHNQMQHFTLVSTKQQKKIVVVVKWFGEGWLTDTDHDHVCSSAFTIHGLWPEYSNGGYPEDCNPSNKFSTSQLSQPLLNQMSCEWVSYTGSNSAFWSHEWSTHGTCALSLLPTQEDYFNTTISLNNIYDPNVSTSWLSKKVVFVLT